MSRVMTAPGQGAKQRASSMPVALVESDTSDSISSPATTAPSSPASFDGDHRTFSLSSIKERAWKSFSSRERDSSSESGRSFRNHGRKLSRSRPLSSPLFETPTRRPSFVSSDHRLSLSTGESTYLSSPILPAAINWESQKIEGIAPLELDTHRPKTKNPYLVVTADYLIKVKSICDPLPLLRRLATDEGKQQASIKTPEPLLVIPISSIVSVFVAESTRPSFGLEVWWRNPGCGQAFCRSDFFFNHPAQRNEQVHDIIRAVRASQQEENATVVLGQDVERMLRRIHENEEPCFAHRKPDIFPVVPRGNTRRECLPKLEDATRKPQESSSFYLIVGTYACHLVEIQKSKGGDPVCQHKTYWLASLERFKAEWIPHEERFNITFRLPFQPPVTLELASRYCREIIRVFGTADRFIKPAWPQLWQSMEIFRIPGLKEPQYLVPREDYGSFKRTLEAYQAAYRCGSVDWEINWKTRFAPEFRLLPPKRGSYSPLQLLAVLRALRYNDYFQSLCFRDVDLSVLYGLKDNTPRKTNVAYLSRTCVALGPEEIEALRVSPVLHQEFHALAFCSETIRQIDFTNCSGSLAKWLAQHGDQGLSLQFLTPILSLLRSGITKCSRLILSSNPLPPIDIEDLAETMKTGTLHALDVSSCGLDDASLRDMVVNTLLDGPSPLQSLSISGNPGRIPAHLVPGMLRNLPELRELSARGSIQAESHFEGPLLPFSTLESLHMLESFDISGYKIDNATFLDLEQFLRHRSRMMDHGLDKLAFNHCRITGAQAATLLDAIGEDDGIHLCLSGNPIEDGIEHLAAAIRQHKGPAGLDMEMIEFKDENKYISLIQALTETKRLLRLSLAGTAPSPPSHGRCSQELVSKLHDFFARNVSIRYLDLSGFCGKLDDSQLGRGFGRSLSGLAHNKTITHLRIRNQNLHEDVGMLGQALAKNNTLRMVDCSGNNLNLTSLRFLVDSLRTNTSIIEFPLPSEERRAIWKTILRGLHRTPSSSALSTTASSTRAVTTTSVTSVATTTMTTTTTSGSGSNTPTHHDPLTREEALLLEAVNAQFTALERRLRENRARLEAAERGAITINSFSWEREREQEQEQEDWRRAFDDMKEKALISTTPYHHHHHDDYHYSRLPSQLLPQR